MNDFIIKPIDEDFNYLFELNDAELKAKGAVKMITDKFPGIPCRVSLEDARIGEEVILFPYQHHKTDSPYQATGAIFIRKNVEKAQPAVNEIPKFLNHRFLSLRGYDKSGFMIEAAACDGKIVKEKLIKFFNNPEISYVHIHNAKPGCFNCVAERMI